MHENKKMSRTELIKRLNIYAKKLVKDDMSVVEIDPYTLLNRYRFDVPAKYIYAKFRELGLKSKWGEELYDEHIRIFNNYCESDGSGKQGIRAFIDAFDNILDSIKNSDFDDEKSIIPIGTNNAVIDGSHRLTSCLLHDKKIKAVILNKQPNFSYSYFRNKKLSSKWCDAIALEYCRLKKDTYIAVVFPSAIGKEDKLKKILNEWKYLL